MQAQSRQSTPARFAHTEMLSAVAAALVGFSLTMLLLGVAYTHDLETLRRAPAIVYALICGLPTPNGTPFALYLMLSLSMFTLVVGLLLVVLLLIPIRRRRPSYPVGRSEKPVEL